MNIYFVYIQVEFVSDTVFMKVCEDINIRAARTIILISSILDLREN